ncbi:MAG: hypothetical protein Q7K57_30055 [Burkholderiaceae bacterium]|nr:hypothetical protein [Burkholderiaceae bacterium]
MNNYFNLKASLLVTAVLMLPMTQAVAAMTDADYKTAKANISADYKADKNACASLAGNNKDVCIEEAKAKEKIANAEIKYNYTGKASDKNKMLQVQAKSAYAVAKEKCDDQGGNAKSVCVKEAKAAETKALADAKLGKQIAEARKDGAQEKIDADYKVAVQKCDALSGDAKASCLATAKAQFGKP